MTTPRRSYTPLTPVLSPVAPTSRRRGPDQQHNVNPPFLECSLDRYMRREDPNYQSTPQSEFTLKQTLYAMGATDETLLQHLAILDQRWDEMFALSGGKLPTMGVKPRPGDTDVLYYPIPSSTLAIRIWEGGMKECGQYCLDFFDITKRIAVNTPDGYDIWNNPYLGQNSYGNRLVSWETAMKVGTVPPGEERFSVQEGSRLVLIRSNADPYFFEIPCRPSEVGNVFARPQAAIPS